MFIQILKVWADIDYVSRIKKNNILISDINNYPLVGHKALQYLAWIKIVNIWNNQIRTDQTNIEVEKLIKELSNLK